MTPRPSPVCALTAALLSCAAPAVQRPAQHANSAPADSGTASEQPASTEVWAAAMLPDLDQAGLVERIDDGSYVTTFGSVRVRVRGENVEIARDITLQPIRGRALSEGHWLFTSMDGALFRAESFTGPLTRVAESRLVRIAGSFIGRGIVTVRDDHRILWLGRHDGSFAPAPLEGTVLDAGFLDSRFGVAIMAPGLLYRTNDGGRTFERIDVGLDAAWEVIPSPAVDASGSDMFGIVTVGGTSVLNATGPLTAVQSPPRAMGARLPEDARQPLLRALFAPFPYAEGAVPLVDERVARIVDHEVVVSVPDGDERNTQRFPTPGDDVHCTLHAWGTHLLAACMRRSAGLGLYSWSGGRSWAMLREFDRWGEIVAGNDGAGIVVASACEEHTEYNGRRPVCVFDGAEWNTRYLPPESSLLAVRGEALLYAEPTVASDGTPQVVVRSLRRTRNEGRPVPLEDPDAELRFASFTPDGAVVGVAENDDHRFTALGRAGAAALAMRPLPDGAEQVAFVDEHRGIAVGRDLTRAWTTVDGARHWTPLALPVEGDVASVAVVPVGRRPSILTNAVTPRVRCRQRACQIGDRVLWAPAPLATRISNGVTFHAAEHAPPAPVDRDALPFDPPDRTNDWRCDLALPHPLANGLRTDETAIAGPGGVIVVHATDPGGTTRVGLRWSGNDTRGAFQASSRVGALPGTPGAPAAGTTRWMGRFIGRDLAVVERCIAGARDHDTCDLIVAQRGGPVRSLGPIGALIGEVVRERGRVHGVFALPAGGLAIHVGTEYPATAGADFDAVVVLDARGSIVSNRRFAWPTGSGPRFLALDGPQSGLLHIVADDTRPVIRPVFYSAAPGAAPRPIGELQRSVNVEACGGMVHDPATMLFGVSGDRAPLRAYLRMRAPGSVSEYMGSEAFRSLIEWGGGSAPCLRGIEMWTNFVEYDRANEALVRLGGVPVLRARNGELGGTLVAAGASGGTFQCSRRPN